jgi:hypothetical protein
MTEEELLVLSLLVPVTFPWESQDNRVGKNLISRLKDQPPMISKTEVSALWRLFWRYRRHVIHPRRAYLLRKAETLRVPPSQNPLFIRVKNLEFKLKKAREQLAAEDAQWLPDGKTLCEVFVKELEL